MRTAAVSLALVLAVAATVSASAFVKPVDRSSSHFPLVGSFKVDVTRPAEQATISYHRTSDRWQSREITVGRFRLDDRIPVGTLAVDAAALAEQTPVPSPAVVGRSRSGAVPVGRLKVDVTRAVGTWPSLEP